jgi:predicted Fe-Mo cluster-binding NifX family protein
MGKHFGGHDATGDLLIRIGLDAPVVKGMGANGLAAFDSSGVAVFAEPVNNVSEAIEAYFAQGLP